MRAKEIRYIKTSEEKVANKFVISVLSSSPVAYRGARQLTRATCQSPTQKKTMIT